MSMTNALNPNVVKTFLDGEFYAEYDLNSNPEIARANDPMVFNQKVSTKAQETLEQFLGVGYLEERGELQDPAEAQPQSVYTQAFINTTFAKGVTVSGRLFDDDQQNVVQDMVRDLAENARVTMDQGAFAVYRTGFSTTYGDGQALYSASHPIVGGTQSNLLTAKLAESSVNTAITTLGTMKGLDGVLKGRLPYFLLCDYTNYKRASIILESELRPAGSNNDMNVYSVKYGIWLKTTPFIGSANPSGSNDYWYVGAKLNPVMRFLREDVRTKMIDRSITKNDSVYYAAQFRQSTGAISYVGTVGSNGTTGSYDT